MLLRRGKNETSQLGTSIFRKEKYVRQSFVIFLEDRENFFYR